MTDKSQTTATCETHGHIWGQMGRCVMCGLFAPAPAPKKHHITVVVGRHTLLALARGEEVHLNEVDASAVVTLIPESFFPSTAILEVLESHE